MPVAAAKALGRAVASLFADQGAGVLVEEVASRPWASATFSGDRHALSLRLTGRNAHGAADAVLPDLDEREFTLPGHVVVDIALRGAERDGDDVRLVLEALTIEAD